MLSRRRWIAATAAVAAGLFCSTGQAFAGLLRRKRHIPECPCPCPAEETSLGVYGPSISITTPASGATVSPSFPAQGYCSATYAPNKWVKCYIRYANGTIFPQNPQLIPVEAAATYWPYDFTNAPTTSGTDWAELHAELYNNAQGTAPFLDSNVHQIKIA